MYPKRYIMKANPVIREDEVNWHDWFYYDPESPTFLINLITRSSKAKEGKPTGCKGTKEIKVNFQGKFYRHARIIWEMFNGPIPDGYTIGFIDNNEFNLLIENLILRSHRQRGLHTRQPLGLSGIRGVHKNKAGRWIASAKMNGQTVYLGSYGSIDEATKARKFALKINKG
ncbi:MAG: HNH endonuclease [Fusobacteriaceae bacterium]